MVFLILTIFYVHVFPSESVAHLHLVLVIGDVFPSSEHGRGPTGVGLSLYFRYVTFLVSLPDLIY